MAKDEKVYPGRTGRGMKDENEINFNRVDGEKWLSFRDLREGKKGKNIPANANF